MSTASRPESDGQTERVNRVLSDMLRNFCTLKLKSRSKVLPILEFTMDNLVHASTGLSELFQVS